MVDLIPKTGPQFPRAASLDGDELFFVWQDGEIKTSIPPDIAAYTSSTQLTATSTTEIDLGEVGETVEFTIEPNKGFRIGTFMQAVGNDGEEDYSITGTIVSYSEVTLVLNVDQVVGSGIGDQWTITTGVAQVSTVFGRTGDVMSEAGDYAASQVDNDSGVVGATAADALDTLADAIGDLEGAALLSAVENQTIAGGAVVTPKDLGTKTAGQTLTLDMGDRPMQYYVNNGAHTLAPGSNHGAAMLDIINGASAGAITTSGFTKVAGDSFTTTNAHKFRCHVSVGQAGSLLVVQALQ